MNTIRAPVHFIQLKKLRVCLELRLEGLDYYTVFKRREDDCISFAATCSLPLATLEFGPEE